MKRYGAWKHQLFIAKERRLLIDLYFFGFSAIRSTFFPFVFSVASSQRVKITFTFWTIMKYEINSFSF